MRNSRLQLMTKIGVLSALAMIAYFIDFPILPAAPYLKMDLSDIPAIIGAFAFGPMVGVFVELIKNILHFIVKSETGGVGELANFVSGAAFVVAASLIYFRNKKRNTAVIGMAVGTVIMTVVMIFANYYVMLPLYAPALFEGPKSVIYNILLTTTLPFNLIKGVLVSIITILIYKRLSPILHKQ